MGEAFLLVLLFLVVIFIVGVLGVICLLKIFEFLQKTEKSVKVLESRVNHYGAKEFLEDIEVFESIVREYTKALNGDVSEQLECEYEDFIVVFSEELKNALENNIDDDDDIDSYEFICNDEDTKTLWCLCSRSSFIDSTLLMDLPTLLEDILHYTTILKLRVLPSRVAR